MVGRDTEEWPGPFAREECCEKTGELCCIPKSLMHKERLNKAYDGRRKD